MTWKNRQTMSFSARSESPKTCSTSPTDCLSPITYKTLGSGTDQQRKSRNAEHMTALMASLASPRSQNKARTQRHLASRPCLSPTVTAMKRLPRAKRCPILRSSVFNTKNSRLAQARSSKTCERTTLLPRHWLAQRIRSLSIGRVLGISHLGEPTDHHPLRKPLSPRALASEASKTRV